MTTYILRNIPPDLWKNFKICVEREELSLRTVILELIEHYINECHRDGIENETKTHP